MAYTTQQVASLVNGRLEGPADLEIGSLGDIDRAAEDALTFIGDAAHARRWSQSRARAALVKEDLQIEAVPGRALIRVANVDLAMATMLERFAPPPVLPDPGIHPAASVHESATIGADVRIGPGAVVGREARLGDGSIVHANATVFDQAQLGEQCVIWSGAVIRERCTLGDRVILHANATLGSDGFGYRPDASGRGLVKIPHLGAVALGNDVEIGAGSSVDRGKFEDTTIGHGTRIDNLVQIGHNCRIGQCVLIAGAAGIAGSVEIGDGVQIGGMVAIRDHLKIGERAILMGCSQVMHDVPAGELWGGSPAREISRAGRVYAAMERLPEIYKDVRRLKKDRQPQSRSGG